MTLIRKLALKISDRVVYYASPGCKEWAEGLERETASIESDWSALSWALGSTRVLLDRHEAPFGSLAEAYAAAQRFAASKRNANAMWIGTPLWIFIYIDKLFHAKTSQERIGLTLILLGWLLLGLISFDQWHSRLKVPPADDIRSLMHFYKTELEHVRDLHSSLRGWVYILDAISLCAGLILSERGGFGTHPVLDGSMCLLWLIIVPLVLHVRRVNVQRLERLEELLAERS